MGKWYGRVDIQEEGVERCVVHGLDTGSTRLITAKRNGLKRVRV